MKVLDIGCGTKKAEPGAIGIDRATGSAADIIWDLDQFPWPLGESEYSRVYIHHVIEHVHDVMRFMSEVHRVSAHGANIFIVTPHYSSHNSFSDPTHVRHLAASSFNYFSGRDFATFTGSSFQFEIVTVEIAFGGNVVLDGLGRWLAKRNVTWYERHAAWILPAQDLKCELKAIKTPS